MSSDDRSKAFRDQLRKRYFPTPARAGLLALAIGVLILIPLLSLAGIQVPGDLWITAAALLLLLYLVLYNDRAGKRGNTTDAK